MKLTRFEEFRHKQMVTKALCTYEKGRRCVPMESDRQCQECLKEEKANNV